jgi:hypothetical protein
MAIMPLRKRRMWKGAIWVSWKLTFEILSGVGGGALKEQAGGCGPGQPGPP